MSHDHAAGDPGASHGVGKWMGWVCSPTFFYLTQFVMLTGLVLSMFNPTFGSETDVWPHQMFTLHGAFLWTPLQAMATATLAALALLVVGLLLPAGRVRGLLGLMSAGIGLVAFQAEPSQLSFWVLPLATAVVGGCVLIRRGDRVRTSVLLLGLALLGGNLFMPWDQHRIARSRLAPGYHCTALAQLDLFVNPPESIMVEFDSEEVASRTPVQGYGRLLLMTLPQSMGLLVFLLGLIALFGVGGGWARWIAGPALLLLVVGLAWVLYHHGSQRLYSEGPEPWQLGLSYLAKLWPGHGACWVLPLAAGVAEAVRPRDS